ncbi:MAG: patatin-like phospholipase family protein, partial [Gammaproteobacteria bacterium]|nr:patatin-like phospholipase family protein [Gammaproteobacteria bacterium]
GLYIVMAGRLPIVIHQEDGSSRLLSEAKAPQMVGEFSLITGSTRTATVHASRESMVAFLDKERFHKYIMQKPRLLASISKMIVQRQNANVRVREIRGRNHHIAVVPLSKNIPLRRVIHMLKKEMRDSARTLAIDSGQFDTLYGKSGSAQTTFSDFFNSSVTAWLDDRESRYGHVLYVADHDWNAWTHRCLNRADRILLLADMSETPALRGIEEKLLAMFAAREHRPRIEYAFLHPPHTSLPRNTSEWLKPRDYAAYHHIRLEDQAHFARLARRLSGRANGLILSGGGARGYVHLGVHRAIEETGLAIDYIGGSSMGALLGGAIAFGLSYQRIFELSEQFANPRALFDYTLPVSAIMKSAKLTSFCHGLYKDQCIEDLWTPYFCISSNLSLGSEHLHQDGLLWQAVRSSIAIPGIFSPVPQKNGELLVDGAVLNTFPVKRMESLLFGGTLIGVNVSQIEALEENYNYGMSLSGWRILGNRLNLFNKNKITAPKILETLLRANDIKSIEELALTRKMLNVLIEPQVNSFSLLDFRSFAKISDIGYRAAMQAFASAGLTQQQLSG